MKNIIMLLMVVLFVVGCASAPKTSTITVLVDKPFVINAEIADTEAAREYGLMFRRELAPNTGMFFVFDDDATQSFWMKNTLIPLDILFINATGSVIDVQTMEPCATVLCPSTVSRVPARYALEIPAGVAKEQDIQTGTKLLIHNSD
ncbi:MAG: DUF192 domain-containing protein [Candidatus Aenigmarchaeota archaeon]|nr:DUF192 domain-containing protein [Candidatus Aenigmarchaeota archaeon]